MLTTCLMPIDSYLEQFSSFYAISVISVKNIRAISRAGESIFSPILATRQISASR